VDSLLREILSSFSSVSGLMNPGIAPLTFLPFAVAIRPLWYRVLATAYVSLSAYLWPFHHFIVLDRLRPKGDWDVADTEYLSGPMMIIQAPIADRWCGRCEPIQMPIIREVALSQVVLFPVQLDL
jgi:hypothetical protein